MSVTLKEGVTLGALFHLADELGWVVIPFQQAPSELRELSTNGGDEDNIIITPKVSNAAPRYEAEYIADRLAVCDYSSYEYLLYDIHITCHS